MLFVFFDFSEFYVDLVGGLEFQATDYIGLVLVASWDASDKTRWAQDDIVVQKILDFWDPYNLLTYPSTNNMSYGRKEIPVEWFDRNNRLRNIDDRCFNIYNVLHHTHASHLVLDIVGLLVDC